MPGLSMVLIRERRIVWEHAFGLRRKGGTEPVTTETVFEAASMSKPLYAYAFLKLVEEGTFELDRPLDTYLETPYLPDQPLSAKITARHVLAHTTGLPNWRKGGWQASGPMEVAFEPGTRFRYSGEGFLFLQRAIEHTVHEPLAPWIQRRLLTPLAMERSHYVWKRAFERDLADGHDDEGAFKSKRHFYEAANAAYSLYTTPHDYALFLLEMLRLDRSAPHSLNAASLSAMLTVQGEHEGQEARSRRGLGWVLTSSAQGGFVEHSGHNGTGFRCHARFHPERGAGLVIMTNASCGHRAIEEILKFAPDGE
ncbi:MAG: beta-lactamase family protein [Planctomycetes bacterium]|nr:beta-lactamase family protein [Planctomycetota bacterium]